MDGALIELGQVFVGGGLGCLAIWLMWWFLYLVRRAGKAKTRTVRRDPPDRETVLVVAQNHAEAARFARRWTHRSFYARLVAVHDVRNITAMKRGTKVVLVGEFWRHPHWREIHQEIMLREFDARVSARQEYIQ